MHTLHTFTRGTRTYRLVLDEDYRVERSCGGHYECTHPHPDRVMADSELATELQGKSTTERQECDYWYNREVEKLLFGEWVALGCIVSEPCKGLDTLKDSNGLTASDWGVEPKRVAHCPCCTGHVETDSFWGIVLDNDVATWEREIPRILYGNEDPYVYEEA